MPVHTRAARVDQPQYAGRRRADVGRQLHPDSQEAKQNELQLLDPPSPPPQRPSGGAGALLAEPLLGFSDRIASQQQASQPR